MERPDKATSWSLGFVSLYFAGMWVPWKALYADTALPAWVQAIGSIGAIFAAGAIASWQSSGASKQEMQRKTESELQRLIVLNVLIGRAIAVTHQLLRRKELQLPDHAFVNVAQRAIKPLEGLRDSLLTLPLFEIPSANLTVVVTTMPRGIEELIGEVDAISSTFNLVGESAGHALFNRVERTAADFLNELSFGQLLCEEEIKRRGGTPIMLAGSPLGIVVVGS